MNKSELMITVFEEGVGSTSYWNRYFIPFAKQEDIKEVSNLYHTKKIYKYEGMEKGFLCRVKDFEVDVMTQEEQTAYAKVA
jgi:hypothetical protein